MPETKMSDIIKTSLEGIKDLSEMETAVGQPIITPSGVTVIPVSKVTVGFLSGGLDFGPKKLINNQSFGGGGGSGVSITPVAFLTISSSSEVNLIHISQAEASTLDRAISLFEKSPDIIERIKNSLT